jgi:hypothetical protein
MSTALVIRLVLWVWLAAAIYVGHTRALAQLPPLGIPATVLSLTILLVLAYRRITPLRTWIDALDLRTIVFLHVIRFVGIYFLVLGQRGVLPQRLALPAGVGDIAVALLALVVALYPFSESTRRRAIYYWNIFGVVDILLVISSGVRTALAGSRDLDAFTQLPLSLLPTFLVPLIIASHLAIFRRLDRPS